MALRGQDHFSALGVPPAASPTQIERAYGKLARDYHPDRFRDRGNDTREIVSEIFERVTEAYRTLADPDARQSYQDGLGSREPEAPVDPSVRALASDRYFRVGEELLKQHRYAEAADSFRRAAELSPESAEYRAYLGWSMWKEDPGAEAPAVAELEEASRLNPKLDIAYLFLGFIHRDAGRTEEAELQFEKAIQCNPDCTEALRELRLLQARHG